MFGLSKLKNLFNGVKNLFGGGADVDGAPKKMGLLKKAFIGGAGVVAVDSAVGNGSMLRSVGEGASEVIEDGIGLVNGAVNPAMNDWNNTQANLETQTSLMGSISNWFNGIMFSLCDLFGFDEGKEFFKQRMINTHEEVRDLTNDTRAMLKQTDADRDARFGEDGPEVSVFQTIGHTLQDGLVDTAAWIASPFSDKDSEQLSAEWNKVVEDTALGIDKPVIDTPEEEMAQQGANILGLFIGGGAFIKGAKAIGTSSIAGGLMNRMTSSAPAVQRFVPSGP